MPVDDFTQEEANQFILDCHFDLDAVKRKLAEKPGLANAYNPQTIESALGASGHLGRADIAECLLAHGAKPELATLAMLGRKDFVHAALANDPALAKSGGAHHISIAFHTALSGDIEIMQMLWDAGAEDEVKGALLGAVMKDRLSMARWLLEHGASLDVKTYDGKTPVQLAEEQDYDEMTELLRTANQAHNA